MAYSRIESIEIQNFMSYEAAKVSFDSTGILNIKGYNDSGKSALLRAIMVCLANINKTVQSKWIRDGAEYFRIVINFDDGISILRDKYKNGQSLYEMYKDKKCIYSTKQGNKLSKVDDVPKPIQEYIGLCDTLNGCLNYQSCTDKMLLVETTGSENYAMLNEVLKTDEIVAAQKMMRYDLSAKNNKIQEDQVSINALNIRKSEYEGYDVDLINSLKEKNDSLKDSANRKDNLEDSISKIKEMQNIVVPPKVDSLEENRLADAFELESILSNFKSVVISPEISEINNHQLQDLKDIVDTYSSYNSVQVTPEVSSIDGEKLAFLQDILSDLQKVVSLPQLVQVDEIVDDYSKKWEELNAINTLLTEWVIDSRSAQDISKEYKARKKELAKCISVLQSKGVNVEICPNCGEAIVEGSAHVHV